MANEQTGFTLKMGTVVENEKYRHVGCDVEVNLASQNDGICLVTQEVGHVQEKSVSRGINHGAQPETPVICGSHEKLRSDHLSARIKLLAEKIHALPPKTLDILEVLVEELTSGKVLNREGNNVTVIDALSRSRQLSHVDVTKANTIQDFRQDSSFNDKELKTEKCLQLIETLKLQCSPRGVVLDPSKVRINKLGQYRENKEFTQQEGVLGKGNCAKDILLVRDEGSGICHVMKCVMLDAFRKEEVKALCELEQSCITPNLYLFRIESNKVFLHMEKIEGKSLQNIIDDHLIDLQKHSPRLAREFSLTVFHGLLTAVKTLHDLKWTHRDLHGGNVMVDTNSMTVRVLDFGSANKLCPTLANDHTCGMKSDVLNAVRLCLAMLIGDDFGDSPTLENYMRTDEQHKNGEVNALLVLIKKTILFPDQEGFGDVSPVMNYIQGLLPRSKHLKDIKVYTHDVISTATRVMFPNFGKENCAVEEVVDLGTKNQIPTLAELKVVNLKTPPAAPSCPPPKSHASGIRLRSRAQDSMKTITPQRHGPQIVNEENMPDVDMGNAQDSTNFKNI